MSAVGLVTQKAKMPGSIVFRSGALPPLVVGSDFRQRPLVDGWYLDCFEHHDDDVVKADYDAVHMRTGRRVPLNWSPYQHYTDAHFAAMVAMDFPKGVSCGPDGQSFRLYPYDVENLYVEHKMQGGRS